MAAVVPLTPSGNPPLAAWFTVRGEFIGVSGIPVRLHPSQAIDPVAWYTADGHRAAVAGPFRDDVMNRQGYLRGGQILAAERMARQVARSRQASHHEPLAAPIAPVAGLGALDWTGITNGGLGTAAQFKQWDLVDVGKDGIERWHSPKTGRWYPVKNQPNGITGPRGEILEEAGRFGKVGKVCFVIGEVISITQGVQAYMDDKLTPEQRNLKMAKAGLDIAMGVVGTFGGPIGFAIATVYFVIDAGVSLATSGQKNILDVPDMLFGAHGPHSTIFRFPREQLLVAPADHTRAVVPVRRPLPPLAERLRHAPIAEHNAVFRSATY